MRPEAAAALPAAAVVDALVRLGLPVRLAPTFVRRAFPGEPIVGPAVPVRHFGSLDVFFEAGAAEPGYTLRQHLAERGGAIET